MKRLLVFSIGLLFGLILHAQTNHFKDSVFSSLRKNYFLNHINNLQQKNNSPVPGIYFKQQVKPIDPCVLQLSKPDLVFVKKYNHTDIYQSSPDKMFIIKPDSSFISNMPVAANN